MIGCRRGEASRLYGEMRLGARAPRHRRPHCHGHRAVIRAHEIGVDSALLQFAAVPTSSSQASGLTSVGAASCLVPSQLYSRHLLRML